MTILLAKQRSLLAVVLQSQRPSSPNNMLGCPLFPRGVGTSLCYCLFVHQPRLALCSGVAWATDCQQGLFEWCHTLNAYPAYRRRWATILNCKLAKNSRQTKAVKPYKVDRQCIDIQGQIICHYTCVVQ